MDIQGTCTNQPTCDLVLLTPHSLQGRFVHSYSAFQDKNLYFCIGKDSEQVASYAKTSYVFFSPADHHTMLACFWLQLKSGGLNSLPSPPPWLCPSLPQAYQVYFICLPPVTLNQPWAWRSVSPVTGLSGGSDWSCMSIICGARARSASRTQSNPLVLSHKYPACMLPTIRTFL